MMDSELLINAVEKRQAIYDKSDCNYSNRNFINVQWREIAEELGSNEYDVKKRWTNLRDYFQRSRREITTKSGFAGGKKKKWFLYENMRFLIPFLSDRQTTNNLPPIYDAETAASDPDTVSQEFFKQEALQLQPLAPVDAATSNEPRDEFSTRSSTPASPCRIPMFSQQRGQKRQARINDIDQKMLETIQTLTDRAAPKEEDPDELFFKSLMPQIKLLNTIDKLKFKNEVMVTLLRYVERISDAT